MRVALKRLHDSSCMVNDSVLASVADVPRKSIDTARSPPKDFAQNDTTTESPVRARKDSPGTCTVTETPASTDFTTSSKPGGGAVGLAVKGLMALV